MPKTRSQRAEQNSGSARMASPWKFLSRLVSPRRQQGQKPAVTDDVTPDNSAITTSAEIPTDAMSTSTDQSVGDEPPPHGHLNAASAALGHSAAVTSAQGTTDVEGRDFVEAADPVQLDSADRIDRGARPAQFRQRAEPSRRGRGKKAEVLEAVPQNSLDSSAVSDDTISLDDEIRLLREQLASKLQLQNAQLRRMLERFER
jgi:hypothetical protein